MKISVLIDHEMYANAFCRDQLGSLEFKLNYHDQTSIYKIKKILIHHMNDEGEYTQREYRLCEKNDMKEIFLSYFICK